MKRVLIAGCGRSLDKYEFNNDTETICLDIRSNVGADIIHNLDDLPLPFPGDYFDEIILSHVLEHINNIYPLIEDFHRILKPNGDVTITVPHYTSPSFWQDPSHKTHFNSYSFDSLQQTIGDHFDTQYPYKMG
jgi:SAM-dependent methyltransferase